jgi:hypothetical protein
MGINGKSISKAAEVNSNQKVGIAPQKYTNPTNDEYFKKNYQ